MDGKATPHSKRTRFREGPPQNRPEIRGKDRFEQNPGPGHEAYTTPKRPLVNDGLDSFSIGIGTSTKGGHQSFAIFGEFGQVVENGT